MSGQPNLHSLYISPLEKCNLQCQMCYTRKAPVQLSGDQILDFVERFRASRLLELVTFCGGEVFLLDWFCDLVNELCQKGLMVEIITNGTIDCLDELTTPSLVNLIVSLDGLKEKHEQNRGHGSFDKTWQFILKAVKLGFHLEIFTVVSQHNYDHLSEFEQWLEEELGWMPRVTYHPRKPSTYLAAHPVDNLQGSVEELGFLTQQQLEQLYKEKRVFPPRQLGCHQLSLMADGQIYACCEGTRPIGKISDKVYDLVERYLDLLEDSPCCPEPNFMCGMGEFLHERKCKGKSKNEKKE